MRSVSAAVRRGSLRARVQARPQLLTRAMSSATIQSGPSSLVKAGAAFGAAVGLGFGVWRMQGGGTGGVSGGGSGSASTSDWASEDIEVPRSTLEARYAFKKKLGKGGFGDVWLAVDVRTGRNVAVKVLSLEMQPRSMVEQEVSAMRRCGRHPNVVQLLEVVWVKPDEHNAFGEAYLVMELAAGGGLFERLVSEGGVHGAASAIMQQAARAVYHLHSRGILHRDIKPENVVVALLHAPPAPAARSWKGCMRRARASHEPRASPRLTVRALCCAVATSDADSSVQLIDFYTAVVLEDEHAKVRTRRIVRPRAARLLSFAHPPATHPTPHRCARAAESARGRTWAPEMLQQPHNHAVDMCAFTPALTPRLPLAVHLQPHSSSIPPHPQAPPPSGGRLHLHVHPCWSASTLRPRPAGVGQRVLPT